MAAVYEFMYERLLKRVRNFLEATEILFLFLGHRDFKWHSEDLNFPPLLLVMIKILPQSIICYYMTSRAGYM